MRHIKRYTQLFESVQELSQEQRDWLDECSKGKWRLNPKTGLVDVSGDFRCNAQKLPSFKGVRFGRISGKFDCSYNSLTSLEGSPQSVGGTFDCSFNSLTSLKGAPQSVGGTFSCHNNSLTSLKGAPQSVSGNFDCSYNSLTSLKGSPQSVGGYFFCSFNSLTSLEGAPRKVSDGFHCDNNTISERTIKEVLKRMSDSGISLGQAVESYWRYISKDDRLYLAKHNPNLSPEDKRGYEALLKFRDKII